MTTAAPELSSASRLGKRVFQPLAPRWVTPLGLRLTEHSGVLGRLPTAMFSTDWVQPVDMVMAPIVSVNWQYSVT